MLAHLMVPTNMSHCDSLFELSSNGPITAPRRRASPAHADRADYMVIEDGQEIGRIYEDSGARPACWFWSITIYVDPMLCIVTDGRLASLQAAMEQFKS